MSYTLPAGSQTPHWLHSQNPLCERKSFLSGSAMLRQPTLAVSDPESSVLCWRHYSIGQIGYRANPPARARTVGNRCRNCP